MLNSERVFTLADLCNEFLKSWEIFFFCPNWSFFFFFFFHVYDSMLSLSVYSLDACANCEQGSIKTKHAFTGMVFFFGIVINTELFMVDALFLFYSTRDGCIVLLNVNVKFAL